MCFCSSHISVITIFRVCGALNKDFTFSSATRHDGAGLCVCVGGGRRRLIGCLSQLEPLQLRRVCDFTAARGTATGAPLSLPKCHFTKTTRRKHPLSSRVTQTLSQVSSCLSANIAGPHVRSPHLNFLCGPRQSPALVHEQNRSEHPRAPLLRLPASSMNYGGRLYLECGGRGKGLAVLLELCSLYALIIY